MRVLCLHDYNQSGKTLQSQLKVLEERLKENHNIELVFVDSPLVCTVGENTNNRITSTTNSSTSSPDDATTTSSVPTTHTRSTITSNTIKLLDNHDHQSYNPNMAVLVVPPRCETSTTTTTTTTTECHQTNYNIIIEEPSTSDDEEVQQLSSLSIHSSLKLPNTSSIHTTTDIVVSTDGCSSITDQNERIYCYYNRQWFERYPSKIYTTEQRYSISDEDTILEQQKVVEYVGLDASLFHLNQLWNRQRMSRPFRGILAFGQGAALAGIIPLIQKRNHGNTKPKIISNHHSFMPGLEFMILVSGYVLNPPPHESKCYSVPSQWHERQDGIIDSSSLETFHIIGRNNTLVTPFQSMCLAKRFTFPKIYQHGGGDHHQLRTADWNAIGRFLVRQKNVLDLSSPEILRLQRQLHTTEEMAVQLMTHTIASNPPRALMAIISPSAVGGWLGSKETRVEDGGGAPCPPEFVRSRTDRERNHSS